MTGRFLRQHPLTIAAAIAMASVLGSVAWLWLRDEEKPPARPVRASILLETLQPVAEAFPPPDNAPLAWPRDHGPHFDQFTEYWLVAGRVTDGEQREYGLQLLLSRAALQRGPVERKSAWAPRAVYAAQMGVTSASGAQHASQRLSRDALGLSGAGARPPRVWLNDWHITFAPAGTATLLAGDDAAELDLELRLPPAVPVAVEGPGYRGYWQPGIAATGEITISGTTHAVSGNVFLDHLWGRSLPFGRGQLRLTRLWLERDDGDALRCRQLRRRAGTGTPLGQCLVRRADGSVTVLERNAFDLTPAPDADDGGGYPLSWRLRLGDDDPPLTLRPLAGASGLPPWPPWRGTMQARGGNEVWGVLEMSNF
ncbi:lipocalin-like domain-containing protein [Arhodomonas sp. AD133]|uniref:lipocalin-like domain-containing protein n=1 Tax=Arhodomonas sp. AD133 TaxID=3415009 RepID=UPI003EBA4E00